jgi:L-alanine-DL-glutamate epimerase-like enolase superfamily enzyme
VTVGLPAAPLVPIAIDTFVFRYPVETPVQTSFGIMRDRPALFVRVMDEDGPVGWGEVWCNFPAVGAEHRARLIESELAPRLLQTKFDSPAAAFKDLTEAMAVLAIQSGEAGPIAQAIAGIDIALWDLAARKLRKPLWKLFGGASATIGLYASGLNPDGPEKLAARRQAEGYRAFKLKVGFGAERDLANLRLLRQTLGNDTDLMVDANQAWTLDGALDMAPRLEEFRPRWLEEPIRADRPWDEWKALAGRTNIPLAAGENLLGDDQFDAAIKAGALKVAQPDVAKWGGFSGCVGVAQKIRSAGLRYCPHWLGGGIGLLASAHLLAAVGGDGLLEVDANPNPLRDALSGPVARPANGTCTLTDAPGLGDIPDPTRIESLSRWMRKD